MAQRISGRYTYDHDGDVVVFLIGMRVNRFRAVRAWVTVQRAMFRMLSELRRDPAQGLLHTHLLTENPRTYVLIQYWSDVESLLRYSRSREHAHRPAWAAFYRVMTAAPGRGDVGIWHETFVVRAGDHEAVYADLPPRGLAAAYGTRPARGGRATAYGRLRRAEPTEPHLGTEPEFTDLVEPTDPS